MAILGDPGAASWGEGIFTGESLQRERESPWAFTLTERVPEAFEIPLADWSEKFSGQSEGGISNSSGTRSVRVNAQGLSRCCCKLSPVKILSPQLAAPGSPRMRYGSVVGWKLSHVLLRICGLWTLFKSRKRPCCKLLVDQAILAENKLETAL